MLYVLYSNYANRNTIGELISLFSTMKCKTLKKIDINLRLLLYKNAYFSIELDQVQHELIIFLWKTRPYNFIVRPYIQLLIYSWSNIQLYIHTSSIYLCDRIQLDKTTWFSMTPKA